MFVFMPLTDTQQQYFKKHCTVLVCSASNLSLSLSLSADFQRFFAVLVSYLLTNKTQIITMDSRNKLSRFTSTAQEYERSGRSNFHHERNNYRDYQPNHQRQQQTFQDLDDDESHHPRSNEHAQDTGLTRYSSDKRHVPWSMMRANQMTTRQFGPMETQSESTTYKRTFNDHRQYSQQWQCDQQQPSYKTSSYNQQQPNYNRSSYDQQQPYNNRSSYDQQQPFRKFKQDSRPYEHMKMRQFQHHQVQKYNSPASKGYVNMKGSSYIASKLRRGRHDDDYKANTTNKKSTNKKSGDCMDTMEDCVHDNERSDYDDQGPNHYNKVPQEIKDGKNGVLITLDEWKPCRNNAVQGVVMPSDDDALVDRTSSYPYDQDLGDSRAQIGSNAWNDRTGRYIASTEANKRIAACFVPKVHTMDMAKELQQNNTCHACLKVHKNDFGVDAMFFSAETYDQDSIKKDTFKIRACIEFKDCNGEQLYCRSFDIQISSISSSISEKHDTTRHFYLHGARQLLNCFAWHVCKAPVPLIDEGIVHQSILPPSLDLQQALGIIKCMKLGVLVPSEEFIEAAKRESTGKMEPLFLTFHKVENDEHIRSMGICKTAPHTQYHQDLIIVKSALDPRSKTKKWSHRMKDAAAVTRAAEEMQSELCSKMKLEGTVNADELQPLVVCNNDMNDNIGTCTAGIPDAEATSVYPIGSLVLRHGLMVPYGQEAVDIMESKMPKHMAKEKAGSILLGAYAACELSCRSHALAEHHYNNTYFLEDTEGDVMHYMAGIVHGILSDYHKQRKMEKRKLLMLVDVEDEYKHSISLGSHPGHVTHALDMGEWGSHLALHKKHNVYMYSICFDGNSTHRADDSSMCHVAQTSEQQGIEQEQGTGQEQGAELHCSEELPSSKPAHNSYAKNPIHIFAFCRKNESKPFAMTGMKFMFVSEAFGLQKDMYGNVEQCAHTMGDITAPFEVDVHQYKSSTSRMVNDVIRLLNDTNKEAGNNVRKMFTLQLSLIHQMCSMFPQQIGQHRRMLRQMLLQGYQKNFTSNSAACKGTSIVDADDICFMTHLLSKTKRDVNPFWWTVPYV